MGTGVGEAAALLSAGAGAYSAFKPKGPDNSAAIAQSQLQQAQNEQQYQQALNALMLRRSTAGYSDNTGNSVTFDPVTNTWKTVQGPGQEAATRSSLSAITDRNTRGVHDSNTVNDALLKRMGGANAAAESTLNRYNNYQDVTPNQIRSSLVNGVINANQQTQRPIIQDTLRTFARQGTAAGSVLAELGRTAFNNLKTGMNDAVTSAYKLAPDINNANRSGILQNWLSLIQGGSPNLSQPNVTPFDGSSTLAQVMASRANGGASAGQAATYGNVGMQNSTNAAYNNLLKTAPNPNQGSADLLAQGNSLANLIKSGGSAYDYFFGGNKQEPNLAGSKVDPPQEAYTTQGMRF